MQDVVTTLIDDPHSPFPNLRHYAVVTEHLTDHRVLLPHAIRVSGEYGSKDSLTKIVACICILTPHLSPLRAETLAEFFLLRRLFRLFSNKSDSMNSRKFFKVETMHKGG